MKRTFLVVAAFLMPLGALAAAPQAVVTEGLDARGMPGRAADDAVEARLLVPAGRALTVAFVDGALVLDAVPLDATDLALPKSHGAEESADCASDVPHGVFWVPRSVAFPERNLASRGDCWDDTHVGPIRGLTLASFGDGTGWADAYDYSSDSYLHAQCFNGAALATNALGAWDQAGGADCYVQAWGLPLDQYSVWDSLVGNAQGAGATSVEWRS